RRSAAGPFQLQRRESASSAVRLTRWSLPRAYEPTLRRWLVSAIDIGAEVSLAKSSIPPNGVVPRPSSTRVLAARPPPPALARVFVTDSGSGSSLCQKFGTSLLTFGCGRAIGVATGWAGDSTSRPRGATKGAGGM